MAEALFHITRGLPYRRSIRVGGAVLVWPDPDSVEVRAQVRKNKSQDSDLVFDLTPFLDLTYDGDDIVITMVLAGAQTQDARAGHVDFVLSDVGVQDVRAIRVLLTTVTVDSLITAAS